MTQPRQSLHTRSILRLKGFPGFCRLILCPDFIVGKLMNLDRPVLGRSEKKGVCYSIDPCKKRGIIRCDV